jgi:hypothetical protein
MGSNVTTIHEENPPVRVGLQAPTLSVSWQQSVWFIYYDRSIVYTMLNVYTMLDVYTMFIAISHPLLPLKPIPSFVRKLHYHSHSLCNTLKAIGLELG